MIMESKYPILEFDDNKAAKLNPTSFVDQLFETDKLIITFFPEVMDKLVDEGKIMQEIWIYLMLWVLPGLCFVAAVEFSTKTSKWARYLLWTEQLGMRGFHTIT